MTGMACGVLHEYAQKLAEIVRGLPGFEIPGALARYDAIGAVLADSVLQAGLNYHHVVAPRVNRLLARYADACSDTRSFYWLLKITTPAELLAWRHYEKPRRLLELTEWLVRRDVFDIDDFREWLRCDRRAAQLRQVRGVGPKSLDYMKNLVGLPTVAVDRHVRNLVFHAGIPINDYDQIREIVVLAADVLCTRADYFDYAIWLYVSRSRRGSRAS